MCSFGAPFASFVHTISLLSAVQQLAKSSTCFLLSILVSLLGGSWSYVGE